MKRKLLLFLSAYTLFFFLLACRKHYCMNSNEGDNAAIANFYWQTLHGHFWFSTYFNENHLRIHLTLLSVLALPLYVICPRMETLFLFNSATIAASGYPFWLICRRVLGRDEAAWAMTVAYLFFPPVVTNHVDQVGFEQLALPCLFWAFYWLQEAKFRPFIGWLALSTLALENIILTLTGFAAYSLIRRKGWKWVAGPLVLVAVYALVVFGLWLHPLTQYLGSLNPLVIFSPDRLLYLAELLSPLMVVTPFLTLDCVFALPALGMNLVMGESSFRVIAWHYNPTVGAMLCLASASAIAKFGKQPTQRACLSLILACCSLVSWPQWFSPSDYTLPPEWPAMKHAINLIPPAASVVAPHAMTAHFANRDSNAVLAVFAPKPMFTGGGWPFEALYKMNFVILDANERRIPSDSPTQELFDGLLKHGYRLVFNESGVLVLQGPGGRP